MQCWYRSLLSDFTKHMKLLERTNLVFVLVQDELFMTVYFAHAVVLAMCLDDPNKENNTAHISLAAKLLMRC